MKMEANPMDKVLTKVIELCPAAVQNGKIDFDRLRKELGDAVDGNIKESYDFTWVGKHEAIIEANKPIRKTLRPAKDESKNWDTTENLYIEGDNLDVLKLLQESYLNKVGMIYIDPPYNTGKDRIYRDNFEKSCADYNAELGLEDEDTGERLFRNTETNGRFHSDWCSMMYPRLKLARDFLTEDGVIFISIDDREVANLRKICDEVFGGDNFICSFIWEKTQHFGRQKLNFYSNQDYILCYAKKLTTVGNAEIKLKELLVETVKTDLEDAPLYNASNGVNTLVFPAGSTKFNMKDGAYLKSKSDDYELLNPVIVENGHNKNEFSLKFRSRWSNATVQEEIAKGTTFWVKTDKFAIRAIYGNDKSANESPKQIIFTNTNNPMHTKGRLNSRIDTSENATSQTADLLGANVFSYPKPVSLISYFISLLFDYKNQRYENDFIVMDFFAGSATTAQAVMELNKKDNGTRKFILVQLPENLDESLRKVGSKNEADILQNAIGFCDRLGRPHSLAEIGKERIRLAGNEIKTKTDKDIDIGFRVLKLDETNMKDVYYAPAELRQTNLLDIVDNVKKDRTPLDLLFGVMIDWGMPLSLPVSEKKIGENTIFIVGNNDLAACFDNKAISEDSIREIAILRPERTVFRDASFSNDAAKINAFEIFKTVCGWDDKQVQNKVKVI